MTRVKDFFHGLGAFFKQKKKVDLSPTEFQIYRGFEEDDIAILRKMMPVKSLIADTYFMDGFGVKTLFKCVPFHDRTKLDVKKLNLPIPDDGFHAEAIEYIAIADVLYRCKSQAHFCAVEIGAAWGPWIAAAGVMAKRNGISSVNLVGVEASKERFALMKKHLIENGLYREGDCLDHEMRYDGILTRLFHGAIWTYDGKIYFPESDISDMGAAASEIKTMEDYRDKQTRYNEIPCISFETLLDGLGVVDFMHIDIQGGELALIREQITWFNSCVKFLVIATHTRSIEGNLIDLLFAQGWQLHREKPCQVHWYQANQVAGKTFLDGCQYWVNLNVVH